MWVDAEELQDGKTLRADVTVVGAGAAGIVIALELAKAGLSVNLIESGKPAYSPRVQALAETPHLGPHHPPIGECTRRQVGGTSVIWGGRVVPFDPVDFDERPHLPNSRWPIGYADVRPFFERACDYLQCGRPEFEARQLPGVTQTSIVPGLPDGDVLTSTLERWSVLNFGSLYGPEIKASDGVTLVHGLTCTEIQTAPRPDGRRRVAGIVARTLDGRNVRLESRHYILASGGLNVARLLLSSDRDDPGGIGNHADKLGRFYTGHITGRVAEVHFLTPPKQTVFGFDRDEGGVYARRRFSFSRECQHREGLANIVAWLANSEISDPAHGNGVLSFAYLALTSPFGKYFAPEAMRKAAVKGAVQGSKGRHVLNMVRDLPKTAAFIPTFGYGRFLAKQKTPGFFQYSRSNVYTLHYAGEQVPDPDSRVTLADERDELGVRRLRIDYRYGAADVRNVVRAHELWDAHLRRHGCGRLVYVERDIDKGIRDQAGDGFHQIGLTRMSADPADGVVTPDCGVHGYDDLSVASSSTFVTAGQANSMFMILAMALRLAERVGRDRAAAVR